MNIGNGIFLMLLLVSGVFATSVALAEDASSTDSEVVDVSDVAALEIAAEEVSRVLTESGEGMSPNLKRVGFASTWSGHGWIENGDSGYHITALWAVQRFATLDADLTNVEDTKVGRTFGRLNIAGDGNYKLVRSNSETSEDSVTFDVVSLVNKRYAYSDTEDAVEGASLSATEELEGRIVGKLSLTKKASYVGLTTWEGSLVFDSGDLSGEWDVEFATTLKKVRQNAVVAGVKEMRQIGKDALEEAGVDSIAELTDEQKAELKDQMGEKKKSFWGRLAFWKRG